MRNFFTLKKSFFVFLAILILLSLLVLSALRNLTGSIEHLKTTEQRRYQATELATAYKSLTQAMTRDVMAFVASEQPEFQESHKRLTAVRSEEHTSELQSLMRTSYAVFCLKKK